MENPPADIREVVTLLTAAVSPDIQKAAFAKFWVRDAAFRHPLVDVPAAYNSREVILGVYQWYRVLSPKLDIHINQVLYDSESNILILDGVQTFHIRWSPFKPAPSRLLVRLALRQEAGLHYIVSQEDFYHPTDFTSLLIPPLVPLVHAFLSAAGTVSNVNARVAQVFGIWRPTPPSAKTD